MGSSQRGWLRKGEAGGCLWYQGCCPHLGPQQQPQELLRELNTPPRYKPPLLAPAKLSLQTLHRSKCCTFAWCPVPAKATKSTAPGEVCPKAQAPNSFCTDKHRAFVSPVVCWLQGGISQEEQGRAAKIITLSGIQSVTNLSRGRRSRHHPAAVHLAV